MYMYQAAPHFQGSPTEPLLCKPNLSQMRRCVAKIAINNLVNDCGENETNMISPGKNAEN